MDYTKEEKQKYAEKFPKIDRTIYGGYMWQYKYGLGEVLNVISKHKLIKDFKNSFDNVSDEPTASELNELLRSVNSQYRIFTYNEGIELWAIVK